MADQPWLVAHPVLEALRTRRGGGQPNRADSNKIGLAIEGGGMRGIVSGAMLCALEDLGLPATVAIPGSTAISAYSC